MRSVRMFLLPVLAVFSLASVAAAQFGLGRGGAPSFNGVFKPVVGRGAAYEIQDQDGKKSTIELAVVGKDSVGGVDGYWMEMTMEGPEGQMVMKSLNIVQEGNVVVSRMIMQLPGRSPMEFPEGLLKRRSTNHPADIRSAADDLGSETITVPAGTFKCEHYRSKDGSGDTWVAQDISPWGLVKFQGKNETMTLTKSITDAKDKITGTPVPFNPMMLGAPPSQ